ncbi:hypothetical protein GCM10027419_39100 [Pandoraea terrae]
MAETAFRQGVGTFVLISTDKAVHATNVMGATQRCAELIVQDFARRAIAGMTGLRPGVKLYEELLIASANASETRQPKIMKADEPCLTPERMETVIARLREQMIDARRSERVSALLMGFALRMDIGQLHPACDARPIAANQA